MSREPRHRPSAADASRVLTLRGPAAGGAHSSESVEESADLHKLIKRREPQIVLVAAPTVIAWFHGEAGKQETNVLEWIMLSVIAGVWITITPWKIVGA